MSRRRGWWAILEYSYRVYIQCLSTELIPQLFSCERKNPRILEYRLACLGGRKSGVEGGGFYTSALFFSLKGMDLSGASEALTEHWYKTAT